MLLSGSPEEKYMKKREGKKNQRFSSIDEAGVQIIRLEIEQKNRSEYFIKMHNCLNFGLWFLWLIEFDPHSVTDLDRKLFLETNRENSNFNA